MLFRSTADEFALCMRELVDVDFPEAERIRVVLDNLSTHTTAALYAAFPLAEARRVLSRLEFHYTPKHASVGWHLIMRTSLSSFQRLGLATNLRMGS